jgi:hypothetical protein
MGAVPPRRVDADGKGGHVTLQTIIERLLRARLYRVGVVIRTEDGENHAVEVRDVDYDGSRSRVVVRREGHGACEFTIPLSRIREVEARSAG